MPSPVLHIATKFPVTHRRAILSLLLISAIILLWPGPRSTSGKNSAVIIPSLLVEGGRAWQHTDNYPFAQELTLLMQSLPAAKDSAAEAQTQHSGVYHYDIEQGDSLSRIFSSHGLSQQQMHQVMAADQSLLALDVLRPGYRLTFQLDDAKQLQTMELFIHAGHRVQYYRDEDGEFSYQELLDAGEWHSTTLVGVIHGSFYTSAKNAGLTDADIAAVHQLFRDKLNFSRDIRSGAQFQVVRSDNYVGSEATGQSRIEGVRLVNRHQQLSAFLHTNGQFYAANGESLERAFMRVPLAQKFRVSDAFNPRRLHPVTGRVRPHNGTDFATPVGTPVLSAADGIVVRVENHPYAGRYIEVQHHGQYKTRYLHLSRALVRKGQQVERGQRIALAGATGRVTGAHLHYELHIGNRPVDPLTANIPLAKPIPHEGREPFFQRVAFMLSEMDKATVLAQQRQNTEPYADADLSVE